MEGADHVT